MSDAARVEGAAAALRARLDPLPGVAVVLGSGLGSLVDALENATAVGFDELPGLPAAGVAGHRGRFVAGVLAGHRVLLQAGRYHAYEGHPRDVVVAPVRVLARAGVGTLILTNACGGVAPGLGPGDVVLLEDHLDWTTRGPLVGPVRDRETRFPDMSAPYDGELRRLALEAAGEVRVRLTEGTYAGVLGPSYESPAEVRMYRGMGADVVGMSTVPEVITARALGLRCLAFSVVGNEAVGHAGAPPLHHEDVLEVVERAARRLQRVLAALLPRIPPRAQPVEAK